MCAVRRVRNQSLLLLFCCYVVVFTCYDEYIFESAHLVRTWTMTQSVAWSDKSTRNMFTFDKKLLVTGSSNSSLQSKKPLILMWQPAFGAVVPDPNACEGCVLTYDQSMASRADAVIFHCAETRNDVTWLPWKHRNQSQRWVWLCMEPPWNVRHVFQKTLTGLRGAFNWTMTYRVDSDVLASYGEVPLMKRSMDEIRSRKNSSLMAAWVVSNCHSPPRERFVEEIRRYISVDVYGKCSGKPLCKGRCMYDTLASAYSTRNLCRDDCEFETLSRYKFYFSLENSQCRDYITEKFWVMGLGSGAVPVVMGPPRRDYELVAPPHSFIHVDDFPSVRKLARYLVRVSRNEKLYASYFRWMADDKWYKKAPPRGAAGRHVTALAESRRHDNANGLCALCQKLLHTPKGHKDVVENLDQWWFGRGYSPSGDSLPICQSGATESGYPLKWVVTLGYTLGFAVVALLVAWISQIRISRNESRIAAREARDKEEVET